MGKIVILIFIISQLVGCASRTYGYSDEEWLSFTPEKREAIIAEVAENMQRNQEAIHNKELIYQNLDHIFGSRSNVYSAWPGKPRRSLVNP